MPCLPASWNQQEQRLDTSQSISGFRTLSSVPILHRTGYEQAYSGRYLEADSDSTASTSTYTVLSMRSHRYSWVLDVEENRNWHALLGNIYDFLTFNLRVLQYYSDTLLGEQPDQPRPIQPPYIMLIVLRFMDMDSHGSRYANLSLLLLSTC